MFVPEVKWKCHQASIPFKILLTMDNCPAHPKHLQGIHPNIKVMFLPPNTTSIMQPLDQEVIRNVKTLYQMRVYALLRQRTETGQEL